MLKINLSEKIKRANGDELPGGQTFAGALVESLEITESKRFKSTKIMGWAISLSKTQELIADAADLTELLEFVEKESKLFPVAKYRIVELIDAALRNGAENA